MQAAVSLGQCYGDLLYYATSMADHFYLGIEYSRPEAYYFWGYYFGANFFWIVIPAGRLHRRPSVGKLLILHSIVIQ